MPRKTLRIIIVLATVSLLGIMATQIFWLVKAFDLREKQFTFNVNFALKNVVSSLCDYDGTDVPSLNPIEKLSSNYFIVRTNKMIDPATLEYFLKAELAKRSISNTFEYGIYNCSNEKIVYSKEVSFEPTLEAQLTKPFPVLDQENYYFGIYFRDRPAYIADEMSIWLFSTLVLLIVVVYFAYTLYVILRQHRLSEIQRDFVNNMTHELKTPLSTIAISADVLKSVNTENDATRMHNYATIISKEANKLSLQVERVLEMVSIENEELPLKKNKLELTEILSEAISDAKILLEAKSGTLDFESVDDAKFSIIGDKFHLKNAFFNIIDNAIKYSDGAPKIVVDATVLKNGKSVRIDIKDEGIGISKANQAMVFDRFYRVSTGDVHNVKGFGIGLHYVKIIVKAHGGSISVVSTIGKGSTLTINLPIWKRA
jgi:two-component system phosphate regulon sensor histidine kinase PhoR